MARINRSDKGNEGSRICLFPGSDGTWSAASAADAQASSGVFFVQEGSYPVDLYYSRLDLNGSSTMEKETCPDQKTLLEALNWIGKCGHLPEALWGFDVDHPMSKELKDVFTASYKMKLSQVKKEAAELTQAIADDVSTSKQPTAVDDLLGHDKSYRYMLLDRMRSDCEYYLGNGNRCEKHLWAGNEKEQIACMKALWHSFPAGEKPEWLPYEKIAEYEKKMVPAKLPLSQQISSASSRAFTDGSALDTKSRETPLEH